MPAYDPRARYPSNQNRISIPTLSGGVGRQAPSKRSVNEAENLDNVLCTLERSVEKRAGTNYIQRFDDVDLNTLSAGMGDLGLIDDGPDSDHFFAWFQISEDQRYLIVIDYKTTNTNNLLKVYKVTPEGFYQCTTTTPSLEYLEYLTYGNTENRAQDVLSVITIGPQLIVLNSLVHAGFSSIEKTFDATESILDADGTTIDAPNADGLTYWVKLGLDGEPYIDGNDRYHEDVLGRKLVYFTTVPVDPESQATIYIQDKYYIKNDQVFTLIPAGTDLHRYLQQNYQVTDTFLFGNILDAANQGYFWEVLEADVPEALIHFHLHGVEVLDHTHDPGLATTSYVKLTFDNEAGRTKFLELDRFRINGLNLPLTADSGGVAYDGYTLSDNGPSPTEWYITWEGNATTDPNNASNVADELHTGWSAGILEQSIGFNIKGTVTDLEWPTSLDDRVTDAGAGDYTLVSDTVLIFSCVRDGIASGEIPRSQPDTGEGESAWILRPDSDGGATAKYIPVEDWKYPDPSKRYLGQNLDDFSEFKFPPKASDHLTDDAEGAATADYLWLNTPPVDMTGEVNQTLLANHDFLSDTGGKGKIYKVENSYAGEAAGYYIVSDHEEQPYVRRIRTPFEYSVLDADRFPKIIKIDQFDDLTGIENFVLENFALEQRRSGTTVTNPGPQCFKDGRQQPIGSMALFRNRLFLSSGDIVFSSRLNDFSDFWLDNPGSINDKDPIETTLSTNKYAAVTTMTPFDSYLFINTGSDTQFTMKGSENRITPFNAEVSPTAFYSTSPLTEPVLLGSQVYFFAPKRMYVYFSDATVSINQAIEVSQHCPNYLPSTYGQVTTIPGYDSVAIVDYDNPKFLYMYTNRYSGSDVTQNAFFRYIFDTDIMSVNSYDNRLFFVTRYEINSGTDIEYKYFLEYTEFYDPDINSPKLDHTLQISELDLTDPAAGSIEYDSGLGQTTITVNGYANQNPNYLYVDVNEEDPLSGVGYDLASGINDGTVISVGTNNGTLSVVINGKLTTSNRIRSFRFGTRYTMTIQLSPQFIRDENANVVEGVFSMRTLHLRHHNTGVYQVEKSVRGRRSVSLVYSPAEVDEKNQNEIDLNMPLPSYEKDGESFTKILGYAAETDLFIVSDSSNPVNVTQIEIKGKFTNRTSGFVR